MIDFLIESFNLERFMFQKIWAIETWTKFSKFDEVIQKYDDIIKSIFRKVFLPYHEIAQH